MSGADATRPATVPDYLGLPLGEFLDSVASGAPAPGGGGASAIAAALASGLACMSARLSGDYLWDATELSERAESLRERLSALARADAEAYGKALSAARLPPGDPGRDAAIERAFGEAADVPLSVAELARDVAEVAVRLCREGNPNLRGDALTAAYLAEAAARSAAELVRINVERIEKTGAGDGEDRSARASGLYRETVALARRASGTG